MAENDVTRQRNWEYDPNAPLSFDLDKLNRRKGQALAKGAHQFQWLSSKVFPPLRTALIDTSLLVGLAVVEFAMHVMDERDRELRIFAMNDCEWWAGWELESVKLEYAKSIGYQLIGQAAQDGMFDGAHELRDEELDRLNFLHDEADRDRPHDKCSFRERLAEMIEAGDTFPCFFGTTEI